LAHETKGRRRRGSGGSSDDVAEPSLDDSIHHMSADELAVVKRSTTNPISHNPLEERDDEGRAPLHFAARWGDMSIVRLLVEKGG